MTPNEIAETFFIIVKRIFKELLKWILIVAGVIFVISIVLIGYNKIDQHFEDSKAKKLAISQAEERACIGGDIVRMEESVNKFSSAVESEESIEQVASKLGGNIIPASDDITQKVLVYEVPTNCSSPFKLLINVRADQKGNLLWFRVWSQDAPPELGYPSDLIEKFTVDFDAKRREKIYQDIRKKAAAEEETRRLAARKQQEESQKKKLELESWNLQHSSTNANQPRNNSAAASTTAENDPCAVGLSKQERLRRLALFGAVKQSSENSYSAGNHSIWFDYFGRLSSCF